MKIMDVKILENVKINQNVVPVIGNSICSPTSSTMLLKYKGHDFSQFDEYENRYIANLARDYGNEIFGNWVYCTVIMTSFGERAYVMRMYSLDELPSYLDMFLGNIGGCIGEVSAVLLALGGAYLIIRHIINRRRIHDNSNILISCSTCHSQGISFSHC